MTATANEPKLLTFEDVAEILGVSVRTVYSLRSRGQLAATKVGRLVRVRRVELERFLDKKTRVNRR